MQWSTTAGNRARTAKLLGPFEIPPHLRVSGPRSIHKADVLGALEGHGPGTD